MFGSYGTFVLSAYGISFICLAVLILYSVRSLRVISQTRIALENEVSYLKLELEQNNQNTATLVDAEDDLYREAS